jgi:hypothetical protein
LGVNTSPDKYHVYWAVQPYSGNDYFQVIQRKLRQVFDGDKKIIDATRVMRVPGTWHLKDPARPHMVTCWQLPGYGSYHDVATIAAALQSVNVIDTATGSRHELGEPSLAAPDLKWLKYGLDLCDPNTLDRGEWIALTSAFKQAGWTLADPDTLFIMWSAWCAGYAQNDTGENLKQWNSIRNTELGWPSFRKRIPSLNGAVTFNNGANVAPQAHLSQPMPAATAPPMPEPPPLDCSGEYLTHAEQSEWFKGCIFIVNDGQMLTSSGRFLNANQFNVAFGGKKFIIDTNGKMVNEPWQAATRSTLWTVPKVDHIRFVPSVAFHEIIVDELGRKGVNVYKPIDVKRQPGDASPFLNHIAALLPDPRDQAVLLAYMAHNVKYPGHKIPWAPVIQSTEGAGKGVIKKIMRHAMGKPYVYYPKATELATSGAQFNAWLRHRLFILVDEIKVDERRELIEVLKPLISEEEAEVQPKGVDQELHDNFSNWLFFTNWKDAIPINKNSRRFAIMYSPLQTVGDLLARGMTEAYFTRLYDWLDAGGAAIVTDYLLNYPIERGSIPMRAPDTSSTSAALDASRSPLERMILEAVEDGLPGFRGGWISLTAVANRIKTTNTVRGNNVSSQTLSTIVEAMGYVSCGRSSRVYFQEDRESRPYLFHYGAAANIDGYGPLQGYAS